MGKQFMKLSFITIGAYLAAAHASAFGKLLLSGQQAASGYAKTLQARD